MEQGLPFPVEFRKVDTVSFGDKLKKWIHEKTPGGRMEKYKARYQELLDQTSGAERYVLMQALDHDAKKYAWGTFTRDVVIAAATIGTIVYGGKRFFQNERNVGKTWKAIQNDVISVGKYPKEAWDKLLKRSGKKIGEGIMEQVGIDAPSVLSAATPAAERLGKTIAESAVAGADAGIGRSIQTRLDTAELGFLNRFIAILDRFGIKAK